MGSRRRRLAARRVIAGLTLISQAECGSERPRVWTSWTPTHTAGDILVRVSTDQSTVAGRRRWHYQLKNVSATVVSIDYTVTETEFDTAWTHVMYDLAPGEAQQGSVWLRSTAKRIEVDARHHR
jgi:hypothetical protein